jgi:uncharacterized protein YecE (DUF72 family)
MLRSGVDFSRQSLAAVVTELAQRGIYVGTSSWKYEGWLGMIYTPGRYQTRGKFSRAKFEATCLAEYSETFKTVCFDGGFYQFPTPKQLEAYLSQVPDDFQLSIKVTEEITVKNFPNLPRYRERANLPNEHFLDPDLFISSFLGPLGPYRGKIGTLIFEFSHFQKGDYENGREFAEALDTFLSRLPKDWKYSVEIRNETFLQPDYFAVLRRHGVAHAFNNWSRMPSVGSQIQQPDSFTADFTSARFLLKPGRGYDQAVKEFQPYTEVKEELPEARAALYELLTPAKQGRPNTRYIYVNNRLEGSAPRTIFAVISELFKTPNAI